MAGSRASSSTSCDRTADSGPRRSPPDPLGGAPNAAPHSRATGRRRSGRVPGRGGGEVGGVLRRRIRGADRARRPLSACLVVLGGGLAGCDLSQTWAGLGNAVTVLEMADRLWQGCRRIGPSAKSGSASSRPPVYGTLRGTRRALTPAGGNTQRSSTTIDKHRVDVLGYHLADVEEGSGDPIVRFHDNPTLSFLWRSVISHFVLHGRCGPSTCQRLLPRLDDRTHLMPAAPATGPSCYPPRRELSVSVAEIDRVLAPATESAGMTRSAFVRPEADPH